MGGAGVGSAIREAEREKKIEEIRKLESELRNLREKEFRRARREFSERRRIQEEELERRLELEREEQRRQREREEEEIDFEDIVGQIEEGLEEPEEKPPRRGRPAYLPAGVAQSASYRRMREEMREKERIEDLERRIEELSLQLT